MIKLQVTENPDDYIIRFGDTTFHQRKQVMFNTEPPMILLEKSVGEEQMDRPQYPDNGGIK